MPATAMAPTTRIFERLKTTPPAKAEKMFILPACERSFAKLMPSSPGAEGQPMRSAPSAAPIE